MHSFELYHTQRNRGNTCRDVKLCRHAPAHEHAAPCLLCGWCWGKGLAAGQRSRRWDFMANAEIGATCERAWPRRGAKTQRGINFTQEKDRLHVPSVGDGKSNSRNLSRLNRKELLPAQSMQKSKNINIIYCPYFPIPVLPPDLHVFELSICLCW